MWVTPVAQRQVNHPRLDLLGLVFEAMPGGSFPPHDVSNWREQIGGSLEMRRREPGGEERKGKKNKRGKGL